MSWARRRLRQDGFTLVELLVVVVILGVLAGIAIATFLMQRDRAVRSAAISSLRNTETVVESIRSETGVLATTAAEYTADQPAFTYVDDPAASDDPNEISVDGDDAVPYVSFAALGGDFCFYLRVDDTVGSFRHREPAEGVDCTGSEFPPGVPGAGWG
ncbi:MAG: prepilin-type N-terminal cleavage/methylation domain-containing protein [Actinobacteria bacterium]|nr:prepilin-type N-terminal cleavage/methylation domain-containing protein [Actinomycetota bacterium]